MKKVNKIVKLIYSFLLALLLCFAVKVNAITTNNLVKGKIDTNSSLVTDVAELTVTGIQSGDKFAAHKILDAFYNSTTNTVSYEFTTNFKAYLDSSTHSSLTVDDYFNLTSGSITSGSTQTTSTLDALASGYISYVKTHSIIGYSMTVSGNTASATLPAGAYLVVPTETLRVYATMVGNLDFEAEGTTWKLNNEAIAAKVSDAGLNKTVSGTEGKNLMNTEFTYTIVATVPQYPTNATNKLYKIIDTTDKGITFIEESLKVKDGETFLNIGEMQDVVRDDAGLIIRGTSTFTDAAGNVVCTLSVTDSTITGVFDVNYITSNTLTITYNAKLNDKAVLGDLGNKNTATLTYSNNPYGTGTHDTTADEGSEGEVTTRVYGIEVLKYAGTDKSNVLEGAEFDVYSDASLNSESKIGTITTDENGIARFPGVIEGTYYLKETKAPVGYRLNTDTIAVKVKVDGAVPAGTVGYYKAEISNARNGILPFTGGSGLLIYSVFGILIIGVAAYITVENQRKKKLNVQE